MADFFQSALPAFLSGSPRRAGTPVSRHACADEGDEPPALLHSSPPASADEGCERGRATGSPGFVGSTRNPDADGFVGPPDSCSHVIDHHPYLPCLPGHGPAWLFRDPSMVEEGCGALSGDSGAFFAALEEPERACEPGTLSLYHVLSRV